MGTPKTPTIAGTARKPWFERIPRPGLLLFLLVQVVLIVAGYVLGARAVLP